MFIFVRIESVKKRGNILKVFNFSSNLNIYRTSFHNWRKYIYSRINREFMELKLNKNPSIFLKRI